MGKSRLSRVIITGIRANVQKLVEGIPKPSQRFLVGMLLGLVMAEGIMLSEVARRLLNFRGITFHALHKGLSRGLKSTQWGAMAVQEAYLRTVKQKLGKERLIACDLGDITKPGASDMPGLKTVRDGSTGELKKGWHLLEIEAITGKKKRHVPLWLELFSVGRRGYKSTWAVIEAAIRELVEQIGPYGTWIFDRGFDKWEFFRFLSELRVCFLIRVNARRIVKDVSDGRKRSIGAVAQRVLKSAPFLWRRKYRGQALLLRTGCQLIEVPQSRQRLSLIVVEGFGRNPLLLVTSRILETAQEAAEWAKVYLERWGVEEAGRLVKQVFKLENIRVLSWAGLVKLVWCAMWAYGLVCLLRFQPRKVYENLLSFFPGFGPVPVFPYYRLAGAVSILLLFTATTMPGIFRAT